MEVSINDQAVQLSENSTLQQALSVMGITHSKGIAIAVNNEVIPKHTWQQHTLNATDRITLIKASQGG